jgi:iron-sulfur cluster repair protein YtfE (RIC family)
MDIHSSLTADHDKLRELIHAIELQRTSPTTLENNLDDLKQFVRQHFAREEIYYRTIDKDMRFSTPGFVHQLRNDHAAMIFGMESLQIRLKKKGPITEWWQHFDKLMAVFLPHMKQEEETLFPEAERLLTADEKERIRQAIESL